MEHLPQGISHQVQVAQESEAVQRGGGGLATRGLHRYTACYMCACVSVGGGKLHS